MRALRAVVLPRVPLAGTLDIRVALMLLSVRLSIRERGTAHALRRAALDREAAEGAAQAGAQPAELALLLLLLLPLRRRDGRPVDGVLVDPRGRAPVLVQPVPALLLGRPLLLQLHRRPQGLDAAPPAALVPRVRAPRPRPRRRPLLHARFPAVALLAPHVVLLVDDDGHPVAHRAFLA